MKVVRFYSVFLPAECLLHVDGCFVGKCSCLFCKIRVPECTA